MSTPTNHLISVIIATYKRPDALDRAIQSVRDEPGDYFDIVIGDDASSDHTSQVVAKHAADKRVRSYCNPVNLGMQENYLKLARFAQGEYVFILTDDDCLLPNSLSKVKQIIERYPSVHYILSDLPSRDERTGKILNVHRACRSNSLFPAGLEGLRLAGSAWVLSRQVMKRNAIDWTTWEKFRRNIYFPIIVAGRLMLNGPAFYLAEPLVMHTFFNQVHWQKFGRDELDIEFNLAADRFACMRSILHDCAATPEVRRLVETWEWNSFKSYLYLEQLGYYDLVQAMGRFEADQKMWTVYPHHQKAFPEEVSAFWRKTWLLRAGASAKSWLRKAFPTLLSLGRRIRDWR